MVMRWILAIWLAATASGWAQSNPNFVKGQIPTAAQWNSYFTGKTDTNNGSVVNLGMSGNTQLSGTVSGNPAFVGGPAFNGGMSLAGPLASSGGSLTGTFGGTPTFSDVVTFSAPSTAVSVTNNATIGGTLTAGSGSTVAATLGGGAANVLLSNTGANGGTIIQGRGTGNVQLLAATQGVGTGYIDVAGTLTLKRNNVMNTGVGLAPGGNSPASFWQDVTWTGTANTGTGTRNFVRGTDTVVSSVTTNFPLWQWEDDYETGFDGNRVAYIFGIHKDAASVSGNNQFVVMQPYAHFDAGEGGDSGTYKGAYWGMNPDFRCSATCDFINQFQGSEWDLRLFAGLHVKVVANMTLHSAQNDAAHGTLTDAYLRFTANNQMTNGTGGRTIGLLYGGVDVKWPFDPTQTTTSKMIGIIPWQQGAVGSGVPSDASKYYVAYGVDLREAYIQQYAWRSSGFWVSGAGSIMMGPGTVTYSGTTTQIDSPNLAEVSAVVVAGGTGYKQHDQIIDSIGGLWDVATVSGGGVATVTLLQTSYASACPASPTATTGGSGAWDATLTITCSSTRGNIILGPGTELGTTDNVGFTQIQTMNGAPTGTCGANGKACIVLDRSNKKLCYSLGGGTWECSGAFTP